MSDALNECRETAQKILDPQKGILAADESTGTISRRFAAVKIESTPQTRRAYRQLLFTTPQIEQFISGIILYDETIRQSSSTGQSFVDLLRLKGIIPGIKVDKGTKPIPSFEKEKISEGVDGLRERLLEYKEIGAKFSKFRAVFSINNNLPSMYCIKANSEILARFSALSQECGILPIIEPEVLMDGSHSIETCEEVTTIVLRTVFDSLFTARVEYEACLLKTNMVLAGKDSQRKPSNEQVAESTLRAFKRSVPAAIPGIVFLSGGQSPVDATGRLDSISKTAKGPWKISFSFSRALQEPSIDAWRGKEENVINAQKLFLHRARCAAAARQGIYSEKLESEEVFLDPKR